MSIIVKDFKPSVVILPSDLISRTDDKLRIIINEQKYWMESETQSAVTQMEEKVDTKVSELASINDAIYNTATVDRKVRRAKTLNITGA